MRTISMLLLALFISACSVTQPPKTPSNDNATDDQTLKSILAQLPTEHQARFAYRHPEQTLAFFGIQPGMTVLEALPGGGWYSKILLPLLGENGHLIGTDYAEDMFPLFGFFSAEQIAKKVTWTKDWPETAQAWRGNNGATISATTFGTLPESMHEQVDAVLFIRALHNLARFENEGAYLSTALKNTYDALKPGGIVGVVQHEARPESSDDWANGSNGYLKKSFIISTFKQAGFEFVAQSGINNNEKDQPNNKDIVWRLAPSYATSKNDATLKAELTAVGESNRMTLKFKKPE